MRIHFFVHESFETPAAIEQWALKKGHSFNSTHFYKGEVPPAHFNDFDFLIVLGGPQSCDTSKEECPHFDGKKEIEFIKQCISHKKLILGICLGAQLLGEAYGAKYEISPQKEIGFFPVRLTTAGKEDPLFKSFADSFDVAHWHGCMPGLPASATVLADSEGCPRQIIRYAHGVYGMQCHFEFTLDSINELIKNSTQELQEEALLNKPFVKIESLLHEQELKKMNKLLFDFLDGMEFMFNSKTIS